MDKRIKIAAFLATALAIAAPAVAGHSHHGSYHGSYHAYQHGIGVGAHSNFGNSSGLAWDHAPAWYRTAPVYAPYSNVASGASLNRAQLTPPRPYSKKGRGCCCR